MSAPLNKHEGCCPLCGGNVNIHPGVLFEEKTGTLKTPTYEVSFTRNEGRIFGLLWRRRSMGLVSRDAILDAMYGDDPDGGPESRKALDVMMHHVRNKLRDSKADVEVVTVIGRGFFLRTIGTGKKTQLHGNRYRGNRPTAEVAA